MECFFLGRPDSGDAKTPGKLRPRGVHHENFLGTVWRAVELSAEGNDAFPFQNAGLYGGAVEAKDNALTSGVHHEHPFGETWRSVEPSSKRSDASPFSLISDDSCAADAPGK